MKWYVRATVAGLVFFGGRGLSRANAEEPSEASSPLTLQEVLEATQSTHPELEAADRSIDKAKGKRLAARGAWDPTLAIGTRWAPMGYYENGQIDARIRQATPLWGVAFYAGYRIGWGDYAVYKGDIETLSGGEIRAGIDVPLWRDGPIDARRAEIQRTEILTNAAHCARNATQLRLGQETAHAYWRWVSTGQEVRIQTELLIVAERRAAALDEQARLGSIPTILVVDNERLVLNRQAKLVAAKRNFREETLKLSLFFRNDQREPIRVSEARVPKRIPEIGAIEEPDEASSEQDALRRRPEICKLLEDRAAAGLDLRLAQNQRAPAVNGQAFISRDFGAGRADLQPTEFGVGFVLEMPLRLRKARGEYHAAKAETSRIDAKLRSLRDEIVTEVRQARVDLSAAKQQIDVARRQVDAAEKLADAEREKFNEGASDLVIVNLRELAAADAARLEVEALAASQQARADYLTATGHGL